MIAGISSACFYPLETEKAVAKLVNAGCPAIEIFLNAYCEVTPDFIAQLKGILAGSGTRVVALHPFSSGMEGMLFFSNYPRRFQDGLDLYKQYMNAALELGGRYIILHGAHKMAYPDLGLYTQRYGILHEEMKKMGGMILHENVERSISREPALFELLSKQIPDAGFVLDIKQAVRSGVDPLVMLKAMKGHIRHVHISDNSAEESCLPVGKGIMNFPLFLDMLRQYGFDEALILELYSFSFCDEKELYGSVNYLGNLIQMGQSSHR